MTGTVTRNEEPGGMGINGVIPGTGRCTLEGCRAPAPTGALMCPPHWRRVPHDVKDALWAALKRWHGGDGDLAELRDAQWACVDAVTA